MKLNSIVASVLTIACSFCVFTSQAAMTMGEFLGSLVDNKMQSDAEVNVNGTLTVDGTIDLNGKNLILLGVTGFSGTGESTITNKDTENLATLTIDVATGKTLENNQVYVKGNLKVVKTGAGTLKLAGSSVYRHEWSGGTLVKGGLLGSNKRTVGERQIFGNPCDVIVEAGASLDNYACCGFNPTKDKITLNGGALCAGYNQTAVFQPSLFLTANSSYTPAKTAVLGSPIDLGTYTLTVAPTGALTWQPASIANGTIYLNSGNFTLGADVGMPVEGKPTANLELGAKANIAGSYTYSVKDLTMTEGATVAGTIDVYGSFQPKGAASGNVKLRKGSKLDLSLQTDTWAAGNLSFAADATEIGIKLADQHGHEDGDLVVQWSTTPSPLPTTFFFVDELEVEAVVVPTGICYGKKAASGVIWTGLAGDGDVANENNWQGGILPTAETPVVFSGEIGMLLFPADCEFPCQSIHFEYATLTADANEYDWMGLNLNKIDGSSVLDINGHVLNLSGDGECTSEGMITDAFGGGEVCFFVDADKTFVNGTMKFGGALKFVKDGAGIFVVMKDDQSYTGGTVVRNGTMKSGVEDLKDTTPFGASEIVIEENAALDPAGSYNWAGQVIVLDGGMISNTVAQSGEGSNHTGYNTTYFDYPFNPTIVINEDSMLVSSGDFNFTGTLRGNGCTLTVDSKTTRWASHDSDEVTVVFTGSTIVKTLKHFAENESQMTVEMMDGTKFDVGGNWAVSNYIAKATSAISNYRGDANEKFKLTIYGLFRPETSDFLGCVMQDGSTLDLTAQDGSFNLYNPQGQRNFEAGVTPWLCQHVTFADGATVTIDVQDRAFTDGEQVVTWAAAPTNLDGLTFKLDEASKAAGYKIKKTEKGLFVCVDTGSEMTVEEIRGALPKGLDGVEIDWTKKTAAEIKEILNTKASNGLLVNENIILGIPQEKDGQFEKKPYLKADTGAGVENGKIKFAFGGINNPKTDKADIEFEILSANNPNAGDWGSAASGKLGVADPVAELPTAGEGQSAVKYFKVRFTVSEKAK